MELKKTAAVMEQQQATRNYGISEFRRELEMMRGQIKQERAVWDASSKEALEQAAEIKHAVLQETIARDAAIAEVHRNHDEVHQQIEQEARQRAVEDEQLKRDLVALRELTRSEELAREDGEER